MDSLVSDIKEFYSVDINNDEVRDIQSAVDELLLSYKRVNNTKRNMFRIEQLELSGCMTEQTNVWKFGSVHHDNTMDKSELKRDPILQLDYLALLYRDMNLDRHTKRACPGHMKIVKQSLNSEINETIGGKVEYISPVELAESFQSELMYSITELCDCNAVSRKSKRFSMSRSRSRTQKGCDRCTIRRDTGFLKKATKADFGLIYEKKNRIIFKWTSKTRSVYAKDIEREDQEPSVLSHVIIVVHIVPAYSLDDEEALLSRVGSRRLLAKSCKVCHHGLCWRISYSRNEANLIQSATQSHRHTFVTLKILVFLAFSKSVHTYLTVPSYLLKTVFLQHIDRCKDKNGNIIDCLSSMLNMLSMSFQAKELRHHFTQHNLLERYEHLRDDFFQERSDCFKIVLHIVTLTDLIGTTNCAVDVMRPYLGNTNNIYKSLLKKGLTLDSHLNMIITQRKRETPFGLKEIRTKLNADDQHAEDRHRAEEESDGEDNIRTVDSSLVHRQLLYARRWRPTYIKRTTFSSKPPQTETYMVNTTQVSHRSKRRRQPKEYYQSLASYMCNIQ